MLNETIGVRYRKHTLTGNTNRANHSTLCLCLMLSMETSSFLAAKHTAGEKALGFIRGNFQQRIKYRLPHLSQL
jgi:hypothetical protein